MSLLALEKEITCPDCSGEGKIKSNYFEWNGFQQCNECSGRGTTKKDTLLGSLAILFGIILIFAAIFVPFGVIYWIAGATGVQIAVGLIVGAALILSHS